MYMHSNEIMNLDFGRPACTRERAPNPFSTCAPLKIYVDSVASA